MNLNFAQTDYSQEEIEAVNKVLSTKWLASGAENEAFEKEFAEYVQSKYAICVNSGSSANLLALASLKLPKGSPVLTAACGFPATLSPILHLGLEPVLVDYDLETHNIDINEVLKQLPFVRAIIFAHTLGNPVDMKLILKLAELFHVPVIEDCCEALGSRIATEQGGQSVGSFGTLGTFSFYPAHQITAGGAGGMVVTNDKYLAREIRSMRDWGKVWDWDEHLGDKKTKWDFPIEDILYFKHYAYMNIGWNMKLPEICAAFGRKQLSKINDIWNKRDQNFKYIYSKLSKWNQFIPIKVIPHARPSWFGYPLTLREGGFNQRNLLGDWLESKGIRIRPFFAGNITRHEPFKEYRVSKFPVADKLMKDSLFFGIGQWMGETELNYIAEQIEKWLLLPSVS